MGRITPFFLPKIYWTVIILTRISRDFKKTLAIGELVNYPLPLITSKNHFISHNGISARTE
jgi:hypothetical protein